MKKLIGNVSVDSGQVMIVDPCHMKDWKDNDFNYRVGIRRKDGTKEYVFGRDVAFWNTPIDAEGGKSMNDLIGDPSWKTFKEYPDKGEFSYSGVCGVTCDDGAGQVGVGVASGSGYGDGSYPVFATFDENGRVVKLEIEFL